jgi:hypothetical protein
MSITLGPIEPSWMGNAMSLPSTVS